MRFTPLFVALFTVALLLIFLVQLGAVSVALEKLGLTEHSAILLMVTSILGSGINLPLFPIRGAPGASSAARSPGVPYRGTTLVAANVGGCLVPVGFCIYLFGHVPLDPLRILAVIAIVAVVSFQVSRVVAGAGIAISPLVPPMVAAIAAPLIMPEQRAAAAYIGGTLGVLLGADLMNLARFRDLKARVASIGGAGTFDGVFVTGILAVLLA